MDMDKSKKFDLITIGSDPEFLVLTNGQIHHAREFFVDLVAGSEEVFTCSNCGETGGGHCGRCREVMSVLKSPEHGEVGWDAHNETGELRPMHGESPADHVEHIGALLKWISERDKLSRLSVVGGDPNGRIVSTGGHIHLGVPVTMEGVTDGMLKIMSTMMLPVAFADGGKDYSIRRATGKADTDDDTFSMNSSYGKLSDWRREVRGQSAVHEFRGLSSSWMSTKELSYVTVATAGAVFEGLLKLKTEHSGKYAALSKRMSPYTKNLNGLHRLALLDRDGVIFSGFSRRIRKEIRGLPTFDKWAREISLALDMRWQKNQVARGGRDIMVGWDLKKTSRIRLSSLRKSFSVPEAELLACIGSCAPSYGDDINVQSYAMEVAKATRVLGWDKNKKYHLYGVKSGVNAFIVMNAAGEGFVAEGKDSKITEEVLQKAKRIACERNEYSFGYTTMEEKRKLVAIGIPYELREKVDLRGFLELIWRVDNDVVELTSEWSKLLPKEKKDAANASTENPDVCAAS